jgi:hypothetical protein
VDTPLSIMDVGTATPPATTAAAAVDDGPAVVVEGRSNAGEQPCVAMVCDIIILLVLIAMPTSPLPKKTVWTQKERVPAYLLPAFVGDPVTDFIQMCHTLGNECAWLE